MSYLKTFREALLNKDFLVLDTETTGIKRGEIVQIAIINSTGEILIDTLVKPTEAIPSDSTKIHGITDDMVKDAPNWIDLAPKVKSTLEGKLLVVYNATYDRGMMYQTAERHKLPKTKWKDISTWLCAMDAFSEFYGEWNSYYSSYRWQKLEFAARHLGIEAVNAHTALGDCIMALGVTKGMLAESEAENG